MESISRVWAIIQSPLAVLLIANLPLANLGAPHFHRGTHLTGVGNHPESIGCLVFSLQTIAHLGAPHFPHQFNLVSVDGTALPFRNLHLLLRQRIICKRGVDNYSESIG